MAQRAAGPVDRTEPTSLTLRVRSRGKVEDLAAEAYALAGMPPSQRTYLTLEDLETRYGATAADFGAIEKLAQQHDLVVVHRSAVERTIVLKGRLGDLLSAFHADLQVYHHASGTYRGRRGEIMIPSALEGIVTGVFGFDTRPKHRSPHRGRRFHGNADAGVNGVPATVYAQRYRFPTQSDGATLDGSGQTIAIIELGGGYRNADLDAFFAAVGLATPNVASVSVDHACSNAAPSDDDGEVMLDIEVAGAVAQKALFAVYFAPNVGDKGFIDAVNAAVHDAQRKPSVISISWGGPERSTDGQAVAAYHELFAAAAALGITVCAASGDHGTADQDPGHWDGAIHVDHPASDDLVLACGGTQIDAGGKDVAWNDGKPFDVNAPGGGGWAGGGGISQVFAVPAYQGDAGLPAAIADGKPGRGVPDIAMSATNYRVRVDGSDSVSGGTSAVAPLMAALVARLNQAIGRRVGFLNPFLYSAAGRGAVDDVLAGSNAIAGSTEGYSAGPGWDACTGLGTPNGEALLGALRAFPPPAV